MARRERLTNPMTQNPDASDSRCRTLFQQDFYETAILAKATPVIVSQYIDWDAMARFNDDIFTQIAEACEVKGLKCILAYKHDWNTEIIAQFFATVYFVERAKDMRQWVLQWRTEGVDYSITYERFAALLGFGEADLELPRIHNEVQLAPIHTKFMYPPTHKKGIWKSFWFVHILFHSQQNI